MKAAYLVLDCETATLPFIREMGLTAEQKKKVSIAKPVIYDIGYTVFTRDGTILKKVSYLVQETFFVPSVFNTAYYKEKRPIYMEKLAKGEIKAKLWNDIAAELLEDCKRVKWVGAYNAIFDFKKAIPFTENYIFNLYSNNYNEWEAKQLRAASYIASGAVKTNSKNKMDMEHFCFRGNKFDIVDIWAVAIEQLVNTYLYKNTCAEFPMLTDSGLYFKSSAESVFRYLSNDYAFDEAHTALSDAEIETDIILTAFRKHKKISKGIMAFPFQELGTTVDFLLKAKKCGKATEKAIANVLNAIETSISNAATAGKSQTYINKLEKAAAILKNF